MLNKGHQRIMKRLAEIGNTGTVSDFVPSVFKYHQSFYNALKGINFVKKTIGRDGRNLFHLSIEGELVINSITDREKRTKGFKGVE